MLENNNRWVIRRLLGSEASLIIDVMQKTSPSLKRHYPHHDEWVKKAIQQIIKGERDAFAIFIPALKSSSTGIEQSSVLCAGSAIIKKRTYSEYVEIKNVLIDKQQFTDDELIDVRKNLLEKIYVYCELRGLRRLMMELPPDDTEMIDFLHKQGFTISSMVNSRYREGDFFYVLTKDLCPRYLGDPFDFYSMVLWILRHRFDLLREQGRRAIVIGEHPNVSVLYELKLELPFGDDLGPSEMRDRAKLNVFCLVSPETEAVTLPRDLFPIDSTIRLLFCNSQDQSIQEFCNQNKTICFTDPDVWAMLGAGIETAQIYFKQREIGGLVVSIGPDHFQEMCRIASNGQKLVYFLRWGGYGRFADYRDDEESTNLIIFYFPIAPNDIVYGSRGVYFFADIERLDIHKADIIWEDYPDMFRLVEHEDYLLFTRHTDEPDVVALVCSNLTYVESGPEFFDLVEQIDDKLARSFYESLLNTYGILTSYITANLRNKFLERYSSQSVHFESKSVRWPKPSTLPPITISQEVHHMSHDWIGALATAAEGLPGGKILLGPLIKLREDEKASERNAKLDQWLAQNSTLTNDVLQTVLEIKANTIDNKAVLDVASYLINEQATKLTGVPMQTSRFPLPITKGTLMKELNGLSLTKDKLRPILLEEDYPEVKAIESEYIIEFVNSIVGQERTLLQRVFQRLSRERPSSAILSFASMNIGD